MIRVKYFSHITAQAVWQKLQRKPFYFTIKLLTCQHFLNLIIVLVNVPSLFCAFFGFL